MPSEKAVEALSDDLAAATKNLTVATKHLTSVTSDLTSVTSDLTDEIAMSPAPLSSASENGASAAPVTPVAPAAPAAPPAVTEQPTGPAPATEKPATMPLKYNTPFSRWLTEHSFVLRLEKVAWGIGDHWWSFDIIVAWAIMVPGILLIVFNDVLFGGGLTYILVSPTWWAATAIGSVLLLVGIVLHIPREPRGTLFEQWPLVRTLAWPLIHDLLGVFGATSISYIACAGIWVAYVNQLVPIAPTSLLAISIVATFFAGLRFWRRPRPAP